MVRSDIVNNADQQKYRNILSTCAMYNLRRLSRLTTNSLNRALLPTGMRCTQYSIMLAAGARPGSTMTALSEYLGMDISTLTRSCENLGQLGFLRFKSGKNREKLVYLTEAGAEKTAESFPIWEKEQKKFIDAFGKKAWEDFLTAIEKYNTAEEKKAAE